MSKELWCQVHEELVAEYLDAFPNADWTTAYESTAEMVDARLADKLADLYDQRRMEQRENSNG
jgi:hypothetical protein